VQGETYVNGNLLSTATFSYDGQENMVESYKPDGTVESHNWSRFDERGNVIESISEGPGEIYFDENIPM
jgi:antitoxin component YwqK of YwqJK toxin-antitoxin module